MTDDGDVLGARSVLARGETAADENRLVQQGESVGGYATDGGALGHFAVITQVDRPVPVRSQPLERLVLLPPIAQIRVGKAPLTSLDLVAGSQEDDLIRIFEWQALDEHGVDQREHGRVDPDPQRQRDRCHDRDTLILQQHPKCEPKILNHSHEDLSPRVTGSLPLPVP